MLAVCGEWMGKGQEWRQEPSQEAAAVIQMGEDVARIRVEAWRWRKSSSKALLAPGRPSPEAKQEVRPW